MAEGPLLAVLQHHSLSTRLIDVSESPIEALYFAVDHEHGADGCLFMVYLHHDAIQQADRIEFSRESLE
ncbi:FRG domain-containing protein [Streptomyces sp. NPDC016566]|uniref:FRG domain-containing protein n=1 Tax=Streptomyces sp. NPDC016566 TaxID=3364967 RepID=UPI0037017D35